MITTVIPYLVGTDNEEVILIGNFFKERKIKTRPYVEVLKVLELRLINRHSKTQQLLIIGTCLPCYELPCTLVAEFREKNRYVRNKNFRKVRELFLRVMKRELLQDVPVIKIAIQC